MRTENNPCLLTYPVILIVLLSTSGLVTVVSNEESLHVNHIIEKGFEHPNAHYEGFVLSDVFLHHVNPSSFDTSKMVHTVTQRKLQFNHQNNRHLATVNNDTNLTTFGYSLFDNLTEEVRSLDASAKLSRSKIRALAKLTFYNQEWEDPKMWYADEIMEGLDADENELYFNAEDTNDVKNVTQTLWKAARQEIRDIVDSINKKENDSASIDFYDTPEDARTQIGLVCLLFKRGSDSILQFRGSVSSVDFSNAISMLEAGITDTKSPLGGTELMKQSWERAGLEWGKDQIDRANEPDWYLQTVFPFITKMLLQRGLAEDIVNAVNGQKIGGVGDEIVLTKKEVREQGYWPVAKAVIEQIRKDLPEDGRILFTGYSIGSGFAQMARMYTEKKYEEKWPVITFAGLGAACFPRKLSGFWHTNYLEDVDPTKYYEDVTDYSLYFDPYGVALGQDIGKSCYLGKYDIDNDLLKNTETSTQYKYCKQVYGYSLVRVISDEQIGLEPLRTQSKHCRFVTHGSYFVMKELARDEELNEDGTTLGGCYQYEGAPFGSQCPANNDSVFEVFSRLVLFIPAIFTLLMRLAFS